MKKTMLSLAAAAMIVSSCIGSFGLTNAVLDWNRSVSNKWVNELIFLPLSVIAYPITGTVDVLVLNSVEFWTGSNPISKVGHTENVWGQDGRLYAVKTLKRGYEITRPTGEKVYFTYNKKDKSWSISENGKEVEIFRFNEDGTIRTSLPNGESIDVAANEQGLYQLRMAYGEGSFFAQR